MTNIFHLVITILPVNVFIGVVKLSKVTSRNVRIHSKLNACYSVKKTLNAFEICEILM